MQTPELPYQPIDCNYYDRLEAWATLRTVCCILYRDENEQQKEVSAIIEDVYTALKVEYMRLDNGLVIRLDKLVAVNDIPVPDHC
ncbi:hypothetical protein [Chitinophaga sp. GbtcB8]|uniref:hypothetical protein n=1 Tax=Chitinophaga sp. GbtcB8 TaxID=2824753 RepID=UPI001C31150B|nr:hypothetical protein [Chitinophaga sp. GbtcB8]